MHFFSSSWFSFSLLSVASSNDFWVFLASTRLSAERAYFRPAFFSGIFDWSLLSIGFDFSLSVGDAPITHRMFSCLDFASMPLSSFLRVWERTEGLNEEFFFVFLVEIELSARLSGFPLYFVSFLSRRLNLSFFVAFVLCSFSCFCKYFWTSDLFLALLNELLAAGWDSWAVTHVKQLEIARCLGSSGDREMSIVLQCQCDC